MHPCLLLAWLTPRRVIAPKPRDIRGAGEIAPRAFDHYRHVHIPKTAGTVFRADAARILPFNATLHTAEKCYCTKYKIRNDAPTILFVRIPETHVLSQFAQCKHSSWARRLPRMVDFLATHDFPDWLDALYTSDDDFGCYNPWNLQTRYLTCHATRYVRDKKYDRLDGHHVVEDGRHHAGFGRTGDVAAATRRIASFSFVGVSEHYHASLCVFAFWVRGALPHGCDCAHSDAFAAAATGSHPSMVHGVPRLSVDTLPAAVRARIAPFVAQDYEVYAAGFRRFAEATGVVEAATGTRVLCARDIQPATRSALGATAAGRRLVAALDAGARPRPKPGLLPRRADGVGRVEPACSFH